MPTDAIGWIWWFFTAIILALFVGILTNLVSPFVKQGGDSWLQRRRLNKQHYREDLERLSHNLDEDFPTIFLYFGSRVLFWVWSTILAGSLALMGYVTGITFALLRVFRIIPIPNTITILIFVGSFMVLLYGLFGMNMCRKIINQSVDLETVHSKRKKEERFEREAIETTS